MKDEITCKSSSVGRLLEAAPDRHGSGRPLAMAADASDAAVGLTIKYQFEFRRVYPKEGMARCDTWERGVDDRCMWRVQTEQFAVEPFFFGDAATPLGEAIDVDWHAWLLSPCSMAVPLHTPGRVVARQVLVARFPCFCWLLRNSFAFADCEDAWLTLPIVRRGKPARGTWGGRTCIPTLAKWEPSKSGRWSAPR